MKPTKRNRQRRATTPESEAGICQAAPLDRAEVLSHLAASARCELSRVLEVGTDGAARLLLPFSQWTPAERACVSEISRQPRSGALIIKFVDRLRALELAGKNLSLWGADAGGNRPTVTIQIGGALGAALAASRRPVTLDVVPVPAQLPAAPAPALPTKPVG